MVLDAGRNVELSAAENRRESQNNSQIKSSGIGATIGLTGKQAGLSFDVYANKGKEKEREQRVTHTGSHITAENEAIIHSGKDTDIVGGKVSGKQVTIHTGENLKLESLQDTHTYTDTSKNAGIHAGYGGGSVSLSGNASKQDIESRHKSVTEQAGVHAGEDGFTVQVGKNTSLQGAVIDSQADAAKNILDTGALSWSDVKNTAKYKASGMGIGLSETTAPAYADSRKLNERGLTPEVLPTVKGDAESVTKAGISAGTIVIRDKENQIQNFSDLNRNTQNSLQKLGEIFDKTKVKERQELVSELGKVGNRAIHELAARKGWQEGSDEKILAHSIFGGLLSSIAGGKIATGALSGGVGEYVNGRIIAAKGVKWVEQHPDEVQWISLAVGSAVGVVTGESSIGSNVSLGGTKWNDEALDLKEITFITFLLGLTQKDNLGRL